MSRAALARDTLNEVALRLMMTALSSAGRRGLALEAFHLTRSRMCEDLGIEPAAETQALYLDILHPLLIPNGALSPATPRPPTVAEVRPPSTPRESEALLTSLPPSQSHQVAVKSRR
jgi:hypothetical protein